VLDTHLVVGSGWVLLGLDVGICMGMERQSWIWLVPACELVFGLRKAFGFDSWFFSQVYMVWL